MRPESLHELADSIRAQGVVQPVVVRPLAQPEQGAEYEIIAGERRWRAAQLAGLMEIPAVIRNVPDEAAVAMSLIENIQRENLNPLEEARALDRLTEEFGMTHQQAADSVGRSRTAVTNLLRLLDLCDPVKGLVEQRQLEMGHARALLALTDAAAQAAAARKVVAGGLSVRATERLVRRLAAAPKRDAPLRRKDPDVAKLELEVGERLGARVEVRHRAGGKGQLVINYNSLEELDGILGHIQ
jgi:ParB family chromosome partitioning protein